MTTTAMQVIGTRAGDPQALEAVAATLPDPGPGEVLLDVLAAGVNPSDAITAEGGHGASGPPFHPGFELCGVLAADARIGSGAASAGDRVVAFRVTGGWASRLVVPARDVFAAPAALDDAAAANLLLAGTTAADLLHAASIRPGETVLVHGASGSVGVSVLQQARLLGVRVIGTASPARFGEVRRFGGEPVEYGDGLEGRVRALAPDGVDAAFDCVGTDEAVAVSLALVPDRSRVLTIVDAARAEQEGFRARGGENSREYRDRIRQHVIDLAAAGDLVVPVARTFPLARAADAVRLLAGRHPGGKLALVP